MSESINGDLSIRAVVNTNDMDWQISPSGSVHRKRVHLVGEPESGQVTSVVRYEPGSSFPAHDHPEGEEILVVQGTFSDEHGDWPAGTYLLNPEGFRHAPFSRDGCLLLVKLRQFPGLDRRHVNINTVGVSWRLSHLPGIMEKPLYHQQPYTDVSRLEYWPPDVYRRKPVVEDGLEMYVLQGELQDSEGRYPAGTWLRFPRGYPLDLSTERGCTLYAKCGGFTYLRTAV